MKKSFKALVTSLVLMAGTSMIQPAIAAGSHDAADGYRVVAPAQPTSKEKVEVLEFFWYGCPHCYQLEPTMKKWKKTLPENVEFTPIAAALNPSWAVHARAYYAAEVMGVLDKFHEPMFDALNKERKRLRTPEKIGEFASSLGIDGDLFVKTMSSFAVETKLRRADQLARAYKLTGVPAVTIAGKYVTGPGAAGSYEALTNIMNDLIAKETKERE